MTIGIPNFRKLWKFVNLGIFQFVSNAIKENFLVKPASVKRSNVKILGVSKYLSFLFHFTKYFLTKLF